MAIINGLKFNEKKQYRIYKIKIFDHITYCSINISKNIINYYTYYI